MIGSVRSSKWARVSYQPRKVRIKKRALAATWGEWGEWMSGQLAQANEKPREK